MKLNNGNKIIHEDDIVLSDGSSLSERLSSQQSTIDKLNSNIKWIYKYGGVGSGTGGGSGGGGIQSFTIYATLNNIQLKDQNIVLNGEGVYPLYIKINNPNGASFNVQYSYTNRSQSGNTITQSQTQILSIENNYTFQTQINLNNNDMLTIVASDGNNTVQIFCNYITSPFIFNTKLVNNKKKEYFTNEIFIENAKKDGINVLLDYKISINAEIDYTYTFKNNVQNGKITDKSNSIIFPIDKELFKEQNAGYYNANIKLDIIPENQDPTSKSYDVQFNLIPENLYMLVIPQLGTIYEHEVENYTEFSPGYITFDYRIYEGIAQNRTYKVQVYLNNSETPIITETVTERQSNQFKIFTSKSGLNTLTVKVSGVTTYTKTYYFYVEHIDSTLTWFENDEEWTQNYYRLDSTTSGFNQFKNKLYIEQTVNSDVIRITDLKIPNPEGNPAINTHLAIGLQLNSINIDNVEILKCFYKSSSNAILTINQREINFNNKKELYIKKQEGADKNEINYYHLIQIYSQFIKKKGNDNFYEVSLYIDGVLEAVFPSLTNSPLLINTMSISPVNAFINLLEVDYKQAIITEDNSFNNNCDFEVYKYFLKYKNQILKIDVTEEAALLAYLPNYNVSLNGRVVVDYANINNIAKNCKQPTLIMTYDASKDEISGTGLSGREAFMSRLEQSYNEEDVGSDLNFPVTIQWGEGQSDVKPITFPDSMKTAQFRASLQGSSTKLYRCKNFDLELENVDDSEQAPVYLYSPNFDKEDKSSFLPEAKFTLKADVVDSSHSNNTSCGKFVNTVCKKFSTTNTNDKSIYKDYVRNCLEGFPFLMYLCVVDKDELNPEIKTYTYYYLGIYNFNLGRSSYYNLGYKNLSVFGDEKNSNLITNSGNGFTFCSITKSQDTLNEGLGVAEIQGGSNYFDFSQYDPSILFQQDLSGNYIDNTYMFGDLVYGSNATKLQLQTAISKFVNKVTLSGGYLFDYLKKNKGSYDLGYKAEKQLNGRFTGESLNQVPDYTNQYKRKISSTGDWTYELKERINKGTEINLRETIIPNPDEQKLAALDFQSLSEYYTICMVLGLVDSVQKNLNIKTWNMDANKGTATWVLAFYDMDTCLGINNQGSDINYFAFSDYWYSNYTTKDGIDYPSDAIIYRDFSPNSIGENGYDIPSSYLFAIAKYAKLIFNDNSDEATVTYTSVYPQELYAKWRSNTINNKTHEGILKNADYFMENFFSNNLGEINPALISYNYRSKYLSLGSNKDSVQWVSIDYQKYNGTRINKVRDWLNGRLHILDVYFNLNRSIINTIQYLDSDSKWKPLLIGNAPVTDVIYSSNYALTKNPDIVILHDIFSEDTSNTGIQLSGDVSIKIKCPDYSPLQIYNANNTIRKNYILGGDNYQNIQFKTTGVQNVKLGGSQAWTFLESINWLNAESLSINSNKLENITGSSGSFGSITLNTANIKTIDLNSGNYRGTLTLDSSAKYPNLYSINISGSKMGLTATGLNCSIINISNINNNQAVVKIANCNKLTSLSYDNVTLGTLNISNIKNNLKNFTIRNTRISNIELSCDESGGIVTIENDSAVESITLTGFSEVVIKNCPKLQRVQFKQNDDIPTTSIKIIECKNDNLCITSTTSVENCKVDLTTINGLQELSLQKCQGIKKIFLPPNVNILPQGFYNLSLLQSLDGTNIKLTGPQIFYNCNKYGMKTDTGNYSDLKVPDSVTDISGLFQQYIITELITIEDVKHFINTAISSKNSITNISYLFYKNAGIVYNRIDFISDLSGSTNNFINMSKFNKVTDARNAFAYCKINCYNSNMWNFGSNTGVNLGAFSEPYEENTVYTTIDLLTNIISKVTNLFSSKENSRIRFEFVDNTGEIISPTEEIKMKDFFNPRGVAPSKLKSLTRFFLSTNQIFDFTDTFTAAWTSLTNIQEFLWLNGIKYKGIDRLFYNLPKLNYLNNVLLESSLDERVNLYTILNWDQYIKNGATSVTACSPDSYYRGSFVLNKYIDSNDYKLLCKQLLTSKFTDISFLFQNCYIVNYDEDDFFFVPSSETYINTSISKLRGLYKNCKLTKSPTDGSSGVKAMSLSPVFFKNFTAIQDVRFAFQGCAFSKPIPFNFFNKRQLDPNVNQNVYIKEGEEYKPAILYQYNYKQEIYSFENLFYLCTWTNDSVQYDPTLYNIPRNRVEYNGQNYDIYYTRTVIPPEDEFSEPQYIYNEKKIFQPTEITDSENLQGYYNAKVSLNNLTDEQGAGTLTNFTLIGDINKLCIPPDLFYGAASIIKPDGNNGILSYNNALNCATPLNGIIPENIFKNKNGTVNHTFNNQNIIPRLIDTYQDSGNTYNIYSHYPSNYTNTQQLDNAFNSKAVIPANEKFGDSIIFNYVFIILEDSINKDVSSMDRAFNYTRNEFQEWPSGQIKGDNNYINYIGKIEDKNIVTGFNMNRFTNLKLDYLFYSGINSIIYGNLFNSEYDISSMKKELNNSYVFQEDTDLPNAISQYIKFPKATKTLNKFINIIHTPTELKSNQIYNSTTSKEFYISEGITFKD